VDVFIGSYNVYESVLVLVLGQAMRPFRFQSRFQTATARR